MSACSKNVGTCTCTLDLVYRLVVGLLYFLLPKGVMIIVSTLWFVHGQVAQEWVVKGFFNPPFP